MGNRGNQFVAHCFAWAAALSLHGCASIESLATKAPFRVKPNSVPYTPLTTASIAASTVPFSNAVASSAPQAASPQAGSTLQSAVAKVPVLPAAYSTIVQAAPQLDEPSSAGAAAVDVDANSPQAWSAVQREGTHPEPIALAQDAIPIDLTSALRLAAGQNPQIGYAQQRIQEANSQMQSAEVMWLPSLRVGGNFNKHEGRIQDVAGSMIETSRGSVYGGLGAQAVGAGSPAVPGLSMNFHLTDAYFQPMIAQQRLCARRHASLAVRNDLLLDTAIAYTSLLESLQLLAVAQQTLLGAERLRDLTRDFAETGEGVLADADRAVAELAVRQVEQLRAQENVRVGSVRLNRLMSQDAAVVLLPTEAQLVPISLASPDTALRELVALGLSNRPELAESRYLVGEALELLNREKYAPLVPSVLLGMSYGGNGGGLGSDIERFGDRMDFDAVAYWELRNLGFGEQAAQGETRSRVGQARWRQVQIMDAVAGEIAEAQIQVQERWAQIELARLGIQAAQDSYRRSSERIQDGEGLPLETLQSLQALDAAQRQYVRAIADSNRAQFNLHRALGWPIQ